jgi:hypothetical protein
MLPAPDDETGATWQRTASARRCPDSEDTDASFTPPEVPSVDAPAFNSQTAKVASVEITSFIFRLPFHLG